MSADDIDLKLTTDRGTEIDKGTGDFATVTGRDRVIQSIVVYILNDTDDMKGEAITKSDVEDFREQIRDGLRDNNFADPPYSVQVSDLNSESITFAISTASEELTHIYNFS
jgi:hypothetical protein